MNRLTKILALVLVMGVLATTMVIAGGQAEGPADGRIRVAYLPPTYDEADFYGQFAEGLWQGLDAAGVNYERLVRSPASHEAHAQQLGIIEDVLTQGVDYIVLGPTSYEAMQPGYQMINEEGIPLIIGNYSDPFPEEYNAHALSFVGYSHYDGGTAMVEYIRDNYPRGTKMAIIQGVPGYITDHRTQIENHEANGMDVVTVQYANFDRAQGFDVAQRILQAYPDVEIILAANSYMTLGAAEAVAAAGRNDIDIFGAGGILEELDGILEGRIKAAWLRDPLDMGFGAADAIIKHMEGREDEIELSFNVPIRVIDSYESIVEYVNPATYTGVGREFPPPRP